MKYFHQKTVNDENNMIRNRRNNDTRACVCMYGVCV